MKCRNLLIVKLGIDYIMKDTIISEIKNAKLSLKPTGPSS
jgi:hypothetical protein